MPGIGLVRCVGHKKAIKPEVAYLYSQEIFGIHRSKSNIEYM